MADDGATTSWESCLDGAAAGNSAGSPTSTTTAAAAAKASSSSTKPAPARRARERHLRDRLDSLHSSENEDDGGDPYAWLSQTAPATPSRGDGEPERRKRRPRQKKRVRPGGDDGGGEGAVAWEDQETEEEEGGDHSDASGAATPKRQSMRVRLQVGVGILRAFLL